MSTSRSRASDRRTDRVESGRLMEPMELPDGLTLHRTTPTFDETSVPAGLLGAHSVADGVWGRLVVSSGSIGFVFDDEPDSTRVVRASEWQVIPPVRAHHLVILGPVTFAVEFHR